MSMKYLGDRFDIHTGGTDLRFPHHEDEIAQSEGAVGHRVVGIWVHGGHLRLAGQKIAKSTGNIVRVQELQDQLFLDRPEDALAVLKEDLRNRPALTALELLVDIDDARSERLGGAARGRRLAGSHEADDRNHTVYRRAHPIRSR